MEKLEDIVGLYLDPPEHALVLCCDEKTQIQALDRTQPGLPIKRGRGQTMTHDYKRNGVTTLFAAMNMQTGKVLSMTEQLHRHQEWLTFLKLIDHQTPKNMQLHLVVDNYATHKSPDVHAWLAKHQRFHMHFTPTSSSWLNMVERFFRDITDKQIRRGVFRSVPELEVAINEYIATHNANPKPFIWTAKASDILAKVTRARAKLNKSTSK
jgi:transposase